jgi:hypothetical protein
VLSGLGGVQIVNPLGRSSEGTRRGAWVMLTLRMCFGTNPRPGAAGHEGAIQNVGQRTWRREWVCRSKLSAATLLSEGMEI